jgi:hypothetical protein
MQVTKLLIGAIFMCIFVSGMAVAVENPHEQITIEGVRPAVFDHDIHLGYGIKCGACHHKSKDEPYTDQEVKSQSNGKTLYCNYCHNEKFENENLRSMKVIMHKQCKACHFKGINGAKGPTRCIGCHKKKKE